MTETGLEFRILVIVICLIFEICDLEFLFLHYSSSLLLSPECLVAAATCLTVLPRSAAPLLAIAACHR